MQDNSVNGEQRQWWLDYVPKYGGLSYLRRIQTTFSCINQTHGVAIDIGCKEGRHCLELIRRGTGYYIGVDIDATQLDHGHSERASVNCAFIRASATRLPLASKSVDLVLCLEVLEHIEDEEAPIKEISRIMKRNALCVLSVPSLNLIRFFIFFLASKLGCLAQRPYMDQDHCREYCKWNFDSKFTTLQHLRRILESNSLTIIEQKACCVMEPPIILQHLKVVREPQKCIRLVNLLASLGTAISRLFKNFGLYTIIVARKS
ncbi:MAG: class I SAM-dependent methyltransferase [Dehalococcoidia bacterium]|nr:class I SAM-dependent methyltransferase [Dehalococcoidia bacterium]